MYQLRIHFKGQPAPYGLHFKSAKAIDLVFNDFVDTRTSQPRTFFSISDDYGVTIGFLVDEVQNMLKCKLADDAAQKFDAQVVIATVEGRKNRELVAAPQLVMPHGG